MTLTQLEYIVAIADFNSFSKAADHCCVTQPGLSIQITNLEDELQMSLFDRKSKPIVPTSYGEEIIKQARIILNEVSNLKALSKGYGTQISGNINVGIIPTVAPYLVPKFLSNLNKKYPELQVIISELTTEQIKQQIKEGKIDLGILVTPLHEDSLNEIPLYYEELLLFSNYYSTKNEIAKEIKPDLLWLLEEGHCLSNQINFICNLRNLKNKNSNFVYKSGSLETIVRLANDSNAQTIIPLMVLDYLPEEIKQKTFEILPAKPFREVSLIHNKSFIRKAVLKAIQEEILTCIPDNWKSIMERNIIPI